MADKVNWRDVLSADLVRQIDADIGRQFAEGWAACQRAVASLTPSRSADVIPPTPADANADARAYPSQRAPRGFWARLLSQELRERFPEPLPLRDAMRSVQARADRFELARSSLNVAVDRLELEGKLRRDHGKLFWVPTADLADRAETRRAEDAEAESDQDLSASAISPFFRRLDDAAA
jgi:hypothetical protein